MARSDVLINARVLRGAAAPSRPGEHAAWRISAGHPSRRPQGGPSLCLGSFGQATSSRDSCPPIPPPSLCSLARGFARCVLVGWKFYKSQVPAGCTSASFPPWSCDKPFGALTSLPTSTLPHIFARTSIISWILPEPFIRKVTPRWLQSGKRSWGEAACAWSLPGAVAPGPGGGEPQKRLRAGATPVEQSRKRREAASWREAGFSARQSGGLSKVRVPSRD